MTFEKSEKIKCLRLRLSESLWIMLKDHAQKKGVSINQLIHSTLTTSLSKKDILLEEHVDRLEKKDIESRVHFTGSEADILRTYAFENGWSLSQEIRYRAVASFAKKPKLNGEELKAIYAVRSSINVLGANINRLVRDQISLSDHNIQYVQELTPLLQDLKDQIRSLEKSSSSRFKLKAKGD